MSRVLHQHYGRPCIILIDEHDVPLDKAHQYGYYPQMVRLIRSLFSQTRVLYATGYLTDAAGAEGMMHQLDVENGAAGFDAACSEALRQMDSCDYSAFLREEGMEAIHRYAIACYKKTCQVVCADSRF